MDVLQLDERRKTTLIMMVYAHHHPASIRYTQKPEENDMTSTRKYPRYLVVLAMLFEIRSLFVVAHVIGQAPEAVAHLARQFVSPAS